MTPRSELAIVGRKESRAQSPKKKEGREGSEGEEERLNNEEVVFHSRNFFSAGPPACLGRRAGDSRAGRRCS
jgi:hypothetical protein